MKQTRFHDIVRGVRNLARQPPSARPHPQQQRVHGQWVVKIHNEHYILRLLTLRPVERTRWHDDNFRDNLPSNAVSSQFCLLLRQDLTHGPVSPQNNTDQQLVPNDPTPQMNDQRLCSHTATPCQGRTQPSRPQSSLRRTDCLKFAAVCSSPCPDHRASGRTRRTPAIHVAVSADRAFETSRRRPLRPSRCFQWPLRSWPLTPVFGSAVSPSEFVNGFVK